MSVRAAGNTLAAGLELLASNDDSSQGGGRGEGQDSTSTGAGGAEVCCWGWPQCGELNGGGGHSQLQSSNPSHQAEKVQCVVLGFAFNHVSRKSLLFFLRVTKLASRLSVCLLRLPNRVESTCIYHTSHGKRALQPSCQARGLAICGDLPQDSTPCKPAQWVCHGNVPQRPAQSSLSRLGHGLAGRKRWIFQTITVIHVLYLAR